MKTLKGSRCEVTGAQEGCGPVRACCVTICNCDGDEVAKLGTCHGQFVIEFCHPHGEDQHCVTLTAEDLCKLKDLVSTAKV